MERAGHASPGEVCDLDAGGPQKFATILSQEAKSYWPWTGMNGQALSLRKFAIRAFDEARRRLL
jgi:hypothetical protein